jgi:hypothetical protein
MTIGPLSHCGGAACAGADAIRPAPAAQAAAHAKTMIRRITRSTVRLIVICVRFVALSAERS